MPDDPRPSSRTAPATWLRDALLYAWFYVHVYVLVQPHLVYQARGPIFSLNREFSGPFIESAGGLSLYASLFLAQFYAWDWLGALVVVGLGVAIGALSHACFGALAGRPVRVVRFLPLILYVVMSCRYDQWPAVGVPWVLTLAGALAFMRAPVRAPGARLALFVLDAALVYYLAAGAFGKLHLVLTLLVFTALCALHEARREPRGLRAAFRAAVLLLATAGIASIAEAWILAVDPTEWAGWWPRPFDWPNALLLAFSLIYPVVGLGVAAGVPGALIRLGRPRERARAAPRANRRAGPATTPRAAASPAREATLRWVLETAVLLWVAFAAVRISTDDAARRAAALDYYAMHARWDEVLDAAAALPMSEYTMLAQHDVDMALSHQGRLAQEMFRHPRVSTKMLLPFEEPPNLGHLWRLVNVLTQLGRVNDAQHFSSEALAMLGNNPHVLQQLATIHMVKGEAAAARIYLNALRGDIVHGGWARRYLEQMERDPQLAGAPDIRHLREVALARDDVAEVTVYLNTPGGEVYLLTETMLFHLLERNPKNRMAVEYLLGIYLLERRLDLFAANLHRFRALGEKALPRAYDEALAVYSEAPGQHVDLRDWAPRPETLERYRSFRQTLQATCEDRALARERAAEAFGDTYFFYHTFVSGACP